MKNKKMNSKGITLIALIITIIVMLILVGVTVNVAINGGLLENAGDSTKKLEEEKILEQIFAMAEIGDNKNFKVKETFDTVKLKFGDKIVWQDPILVDENTDLVNFKIKSRNTEYEYHIESTEISKGIKEKTGPLGFTFNQIHQYNKQLIQIFNTGFDGNLTDEEIEAGCLEFITTKQYDENNTVTVIAIFIQPLWMDIQQPLDRIYGSAVDGLEYGNFTPKNPNNTMSSNNSLFTEYNSEINSKYKFVFAGEGEGLATLILGECTENGYKPVATANGDSENGIMSWQEFLQNYGDVQIIFDDAKPIQYKDITFEQYILGENLTGRDWTEIGYDKQFEKKSIKRYQKDENEDGDEYEFIEYNNKRYRVTVDKKTNLTKELIETHEGEKITYIGQDGLEEEWTILYENNDGTCEIVSPYIYGNLKLGSSISGDNAYYITESINSYNNAIDTINTYCKSQEIRNLLPNELKNVDDSKIRSVGAKEDLTSDYYNVPDTEEYDFARVYNGRIKIDNTSDGERDKKIMRAWDVYKAQKHVGEGEGDFYWIAARNIQIPYDISKFSIIVQHAEMKNTITLDNRAILWHKKEKQQYLRQLLAKGETGAVRLIITVPTPE